MREDMPHLLTLNQPVEGENIVWLEEKKYSYGLKNLLITVGKKIKKIRNKKNAIVSGSLI